MRPLKEKKGVFQYPLDNLLGTPAAIRTLRVFCLFGGVLSPPTIVARAGISKNAVWVTLKRLTDVGVLRTIGQGRATGYELATDHPLVETLKMLFQLERRRADAMLTAVRRAAMRLSPAPRAVWLYGSVARNEDDAISDLDLAIVTDDANASASAETTPSPGGAEERHSVC
jgi:biotin operon repressor